VEETTLVTAMFKVVGGVGQCMRCSYLYQYNVLGKHSIEVMHVRTILLLLLLASYYIASHI
jgi:hypothetical protein